MAPYASADRQALLAVARDAIRAQREGTRAPPPEHASSRLIEHRGVFVTLLSGGEEVACVGRVVSDDPLLTAVASTAAALVEDPKAKALSREQWDAASVEISILGGLHPVKDLLDVRAGVDGLVLQTDGREAVILPSEADEGPSSREALLAKLAEKAGLPQEKWGKDSVKSFTTQEVREDSGHPDAGSR